MADRLVNDVACLKPIAVSTPAISKSVSTISPIGPSLNKCRILSGRGVVLVFHLSSVGEDNRYYCPIVAIVERGRPFHGGKRADLVKIDGLDMSEFPLPVSNANAIHGD